MERAQTKGEMMKNSAIAIIALVSMASPAIASNETTATPSLRQIVDQIAAEGSAIVHVDANRTVRLVRDQSQCALDEQLAPVWINFADVRQLHLAGYVCESLIE
jgi:hypothetical protein